MTPAGDQQEEDRETESDVTLRMHKGEDARSLKFGVFRSSGKSDHIPDIAHAGHELNHSLKAQPESRMGYGSEAACVQVPPKFGGGYVHLLHALFQSVQPFLPL